MFWLLQWKQFAERHSTKEMNEKQTDHETAANAAEEAPREITTKEAYFTALNEWVKHANISQNAMAMFPWYFMSSYPQLFTQPATSNFMPVMGLQMPSQNAQPVNGNNTPPVGRFGFRIMNEHAQTELINRHGGYEYVVAPFWKRAVAEFIDMIIMLVFKIVALFVITYVLGHDVTIGIDENVLIKALEEEDLAGVFLYYMEFFPDLFSSDLLAFEIATKLFVCLYEAECTTYYNGASVGKYIMGLSIKYVEAMVPLPDNNILGMRAQPVPQMQLGFPATRTQMRALLFPAETPTFKRAFGRALFKNSILSILFPMIFLMVLFKNNRTAYDILAKTIVVETPTHPVVLRRPAQQQQ